MKEKILKNLKVICLAKLSNAKKEDNQKNIEIYTIINDVLNTENSLIKLDMEVVVNMIYDLVEDIEKAKEIYVQLLKRKKANFAFFF